MIPVIDPSGKKGTPTMGETEIAKGKAQILVPPTPKPKPKKPVVKAPTAKKLTPFEEAKKAQAKVGAIEKELKAAKVAAAKEQAKVEAMAKATQAKAAKKLADIAKAKAAQLAKEQAAKAKVADALAKAQKVAAAKAKAQKVAAAKAKATKLAKAKAEAKAIVDKAKAAQAAKKAKAAQAEGKAIAKAIEDAPKEDGWIKSPSGKWVKDPAYGVAGKSAKEIEDQKKWLLEAFVGDKPGQMTTEEYFASIDKQVKAKVKAEAAAAVKAEAAAAVKAAKLPSLNPYDVAQAKAEKAAAVRAKAAAAKPIRKPLKAPGTKSPTGLQLPPGVDANDLKLTELTNTFYDLEATAKIVYDNEAKARVLIEMERVKDAVREFNKAGAARKVRLLKPSVLEETAIEKKVLKYADNMGKLTESEIRELIAKDPVFRRRAEAIELFSGHSVPTVRDPGLFTTKHAKAGPLHVKAKAVVGKDVGVQSRALIVKPTLEHYEDAHDYMSWLAERTVDKALLKQPHWRGVKLPPAVVESLAPGQKFPLNAMDSFSRKRHTAHGFAHSPSATGTSVLFSFPKGLKRGTDIRALSAYAGEAETVSTGIVKVISKKWNAATDTWLIEAEML